MGNKKRTIILALLSALLYLFPCDNTYTQQETFASISGSVIDQETNKPVESAIVFLTNTFWGTSTDTLGNFILTNIEPGEYDLIISRVGYIRQIKRLQITKNDTLFYKINLVVHPIQTGEVEILGEQPESMKFQPYLFPSTKDDAYCVYSIGSTLPIGLLFTDSAFFMYSLEPTIVDTEKYIRLWLLYKNFSNTPKEFDPLTSIKLSINKQGRLYKGIPPESFSDLMIILDTNQLTNSILNNFTIPLQFMASVNQKLRDYAKGIFGDLGGIGGSGRRSMAPIKLFETFQSGYNDKLLKKHIVYPDNAVHGYLYFSFPGLNWQTTDTRFDDAYLNQYELDITSPTETRTIVFTAH